MIARFEFNGATVHSKVVKENDKTVEVMVPTCNNCKGSGVYHYKAYAWNEKTKKHDRLVYRREACRDCWGGNNWKRIKLKKKKCKVMDSVPTSFPSPSFWAHKETKRHGEQVHRTTKG